MQCHDPQPLAEPESRAYWLALFSHAEWQRFVDRGATVAGFRRRRWRTVRQIRPGDRLLCYLTGACRWIGLLEVVSFPYLDTAPRWEEVLSAPYSAGAPLWEEDRFPAKIRVKSVVTLIPESAVPVLVLRDELALFRDLPHPNAWAARFRSSPARWRPADAAVVIRALWAAKANPTVADGIAEHPPAYSAPAMTAHTEIQWLLLKLGNDMGLEIWAARNDKGREYDGRRFSSLPKFRERLPLQFDKATTRTVELIDVLWLKGNAIVAAFEIESTTSIYSGLLRMADLVTMQPNLNIPLYLVVPDERRAKVIAEVNRPTFSRLSPPLSELCRLITFSELRDRLTRAAPLLRFLKPDFLEDLSESCAVDDG